MPGLVNRAIRYNAPDLKPGATPTLRMRKKGRKFLHCDFSLTIIKTMFPTACADWNSRISGRCATEFGGIDPV